MRLYLALFLFLILNGATLPFMLRAIGKLAREKAEHPFLWQMITALSVVFASFIAGLVGVGVMLIFEIEIFWAYALIIPVGWLTYLLIRRNLTSHARDEEESKDNLV